VIVVCYQVAGNNFVRPSPLDDRNGKRSSGGAQSGNDLRARS
jgi:hypothetical protein